MRKRKKILVVDHDPDLLMVLEQFLEDAGYTTTTTWDGREALSHIEGAHFDEVIVGDHASFANCSEFLALLRSRDSETVCILLGAEHSRLSDDELRTLRVRAVISRWNLKEVLETTQRAIGSRRHSAA